MRFEIGFRVEVDPEFPADGGEPPERIPAGLPRIGAVLRVTPPDDLPWDIAIGSRTWARTPNPSGLAFLSDGGGYVVDVVERRILVDVAGAVRITEDEVHDLLLFVTETDITAVASDGIAWTTPRLAFDDLKVTAIERDRIICTGYDGGPRSGATVDPRDGSQLSGRRF